MRTGNAHPVKQVAALIHLKLDPGLLELAQQAAQVMAAGRAGDGRQGAGSTRPVAGPVVQAQAAVARARAAPLE